jgi:hypothetical protein
MVTRNREAPIVGTSTFRLITRTVLVSTDVTVANPLVYCRVPPYAFPESLVPSEE